MGIVLEKGKEYSIEKIVKMLDKKYNRKRANVKFLAKSQTPLQKAFSIFANVFLGLLVIFSALFCFNMINSRAQGTPASVFGYSALKIVSGSMEPEFKIGDAILVHSVKPHTLKTGDNIAFYVNSAKTKEYQTKKLTTVDKMSDKIEFNTTYNQMLGIQSNPIRLAAQSGSTLVFHQIIAIEEDENGYWWFQTKGLNNSSADMWRIGEDMIVGIHVDGGLANVFSGLLSSSQSSSSFLVMLIIPIVLLGVMVSLDSFRNVQLARLELECIEEKRKITDPICVKNNVGLNMDKKSKYKVLATADDSEKMAYVNVLWEEDKIPNSVRKYIMRRNHILHPLEKLRDINRECEKMYKEGKDLVSIGKYYEKERSKIENEVQSRYSRLIQLDDDA